KGQIFGGLDVESISILEQNITFDFEKGYVLMRNLIKYVTITIVCDPKDTPIFRHCPSWDIGAH
ncbi:hypothetical protein METBIDRAFT_43814, partial [Metschnikowia bicuspidata var. bicuspidata NRRL YB-4993]